MFNRIHTHNLFKLENMALLSSFWYLDLTILLLTLVFILYKYVTRNFGYWKQRGVPELTPKPFYGNLKEMVRVQTPNAQLFQKFYNIGKHPFFGIYCFDKPALVLRDPELIKAVLVKDSNIFINRSSNAYEQNDLLSAHILLFMKDEEWKTFRTKLSPVFTAGKLKLMTNLIFDVGKDMEEYLETMQSDTICAKELGLNFFIDTISSCVFGINANTFKKNKSSEFLKIGQALFKSNVLNAINQILIFFGPHIGKILGAKFIDKQTQKFLADTFEETIEQRMKSGTTRNDLIDVLVQMKKENFEMIKLVSQAFNFFAAGFETSANTTSFTLFELCQNQDLQNKLRDEVTGLLAKFKGEITYEALHEMKYMDMCINETLRKYPVFPIIERICNQDYKLPNSEVVLEKGITIFVPLLGLQHDPEYFSEPETYDPERFSPENLENIVPFSYIPFGAGPRHCIGERFGRIAIKVCLTHIISKYEVIKCPATPTQIEYDPKAIAIVSKTGFPMKIKKLK